MSIYGTGKIIGAPIDEEWDGLPGPYPYGVIRTRDGWEGGGSNMYPTDATGLHANVSVDRIPGHCVPGHDSDATGWGDRLRLTIAAGNDHEDATIHGPSGQLILDRTAALHLARELIDWATDDLLAPKADA